MVSHHQLPPYAGPPAPAPSAPQLSHRAASISSGRSTTRRHRHARSHHGGSSAHLPQNEFPIFSHTGDVEITITSANGRKENRYLLHRLILSQCSGFFDAGTRAEWSGRAADDARTTHGSASINESIRGPTGVSSRASSQERTSAGGQSVRRWRYILDWKGTGENEAPMLVQQDNGPASIFGDGRSDRPPPIRSKPPTSNEGFFRSAANLSEMSFDQTSQASTPTHPGDEVLKDYDNLFRTMYQYTPILDGINIATAYSECKALLHLADMYDALEIVGSRVDHHLLRFGARLFKQIAKYPPSYLKLGYLARSRTIFTEALIHVVGQWPLAAPLLRGHVETSVLDLIEDKADEMREMEERVESKLWRLTLTTNRGERVTPANDFLGWSAISVFRQWYADNTPSPTTSILKDTLHTGTSTQRSRTSNISSNHVASQRYQPTRQPVPAPQPGRVYRLLGSTSPDTYLTHDELKRYLKLLPDLYSRDNLRRLERRMDELKNLARDAVKPLMRNFLEVDLAAFGPGGLGYLTCIRLEDRDLPWEE
nr:hypothetical protein CFP56_70558 [Quercus suber]